jgi:cytochrome c oxidase subunit 3
VLGLTFTCVQAFEYSHAAFTFSGNVYGATFFMATGFHGFHVIIGTTFLIVCLIRAYLGHFTPTQHLGFEFRGRCLDLPVRLHLCVGFGR